ncbi:hypothetical protein [Nitrospira sp. Nam74]
MDNPSSTISGEDHTFHHQKLDEKTVCTVQTLEAAHKELTALVKAADAVIAENADDSKDEEWKFASPTLDETAAFLKEVKESDGLLRKLISEVQDAQGQGDRLVRSDQLIQRALASLELSHELLDRTVDL